MNKEQLQKYAELLAKVGLNVKKGQTVFVEAGLDQPDFVTMVVEECYKAGACTWTGATSRLQRSTPTIER